MSDVYIPGVRSRFNSDKLIEDLMQVERVPRERTEKNVESLESRKTWWQDMGRRISSLRESASRLFSFQNPFNERIATSSDENIISATASRGATEQEYHFTVKQLAQADRFLSQPLDAGTTIDAGTYTFTVGKDEISFDFRGGSLQEFADAVNRRGRDKIGASLMTVQPGSRSLLLESKITGAENRLGFSDDAAQLVEQLGIAERANDSRREVAITEDTVRENSLPGWQADGPIGVNDGILELPSLASASISLNLQVEQGSPLVLELKTATVVREEVPQPIPEPPSGPNVSSPGSVSYDGVTITNDPSTAPLPEWTPPEPPPRLDNLGVLSLVFSDGTKAALPPITDTEDFETRQYNLAEFAGGKTIVALNIDNANTFRSIAIQDASVFDPNVPDGGYKPLRAVSTAQNAIVSMEGIDMTRPSNVISDIIPSVTVTARGVSEKPVRLEIRPDREGIKDSIITLVGNYNRLMAELNILTSARRTGQWQNSQPDSTVIDELAAYWWQPYQDRDELNEMKERLGAFSGDSTVTQFKSNLMRAVTAAYPTDAERDLALLAQIGIGTNTQGLAGYSASRMRGYLEVDPIALDSALERNLPAIRQLFGSDTTGDMIVDTGIAFNLDALSKPFVELGGIVSLKTGSIDSQITQDRRRMDTMDRQLAAKEADLRIQFSRMESAYARMEQMSTSLDNFNQQNRSNNR